MHTNMIWVRYIITQRRFITGLTMRRSRHIQCQPVHFFLSIRVDTSHYRCDMMNLWKRRQNESLHRWSSPHHCSPQRTRMHQPNHPTHVMPHCTHGVRRMIMPTITMRRGHCSHVRSTPIQSATWIHANGPCSRQCTYRTDNRVPLPHRHNGQ